MVANDMPTVQTALVYGEGQPSVAVNPSRSRPV
jgi:hypothetical protein